jgi:peptidoglycan hydrolase-like protein with peptidoglycan-binding domain
MIKISKTLGREYNVALEDVKKVKSALLKLGYYQTPKYGMTPYPDEELFRAVKAFQKDKGLKVDGIMRPDGETVMALNGKLPSELPGVRSPTFWCKCGAPHGGVFGDVCKDCYFK